ncbi:hypothetical protein HK405_002641, partial [Cladochytrium tenue]
SPTPFAPNAARRAGPLAHRCDRPAAVPGRCALRSGDCALRWRRRSGRTGTAPCRGRTQGVGAAGGCGRRGVLWKRGRRRAIIRRSRGSNAVGGAGGCAAPCV